MPRNFLAQHGPSPPLGHLKYRCNAQMILVWQIRVSETATDLDALFSLMSAKRHFHHLIEKSLENHHLNSTDSGDLHWGKNKALVSTTSSASFICVGQVDHGIWMHMVYGSVIEYTNHRLVGQHTQAPAPILFSSPASHDSRAKLVWRPSQYFAATAWGNRQLNMKFDMI